MFNIKKSYLVLLCITLLLVIFPLHTNEAATKPAPKTESDWHLFPTRDEVEYSIDMKSIKLVDGYLSFLGKIDDPKETYVSYSYFTINLPDKEFRYEISAKVEKITLRGISLTKIPSEWEPLLANTPLDIAVTYILEHHPDAKKILDKTKE